MDELGWAGLRIIPTFQGFGSHLQAGVRGASGSVAHSEGERFGTNFATRAGGAIHSKLSQTAKYVIGPLLGAFAVEKIGELVGESITAASNLEAARARSHVIFGGMAKDADEFGERAAKSLGLSHLAALQAETGFGLLGQRMGLNNRDNVEFSQRFTKVADDLAAFNHSDPATAFLAIQRGVAGATRGLKPYGVLIDSTSIKAEALADGILRPVKDQAVIHAAQVRVLSDQQAYTLAVTSHGKASLEAQKAAASLGTAQDSLNKVTEGAVPPLTQQQKMLAASKLILKQTSQQQGAFADSTHHLYGQQRILSASFDDAKDRLGKGLLPIATDFTQYLNRNLVPAVDEASKWFEHKGAPAIHDFADELAPLVNSALPALGTGFHDAYLAAKDLLPVAKGIFDTFNALPDGVQKAIIYGGAAAYVGKRTGLLGGLLGRGGAAGLAGEAASLAHPIPVLVVNEGFGGPGGVVGKGGTLAAEEGAAASAAKESGWLSKLLGKVGLSGAAEKLSLGGAARLGGYALEAPALVTLGDIGNEVNPQHAIPLTSVGQLRPTLPKAGSPAGLGFQNPDSSSWEKLDAVFARMVKSGNISAVDDQLAQLEKQSGIIEGDPTKGIRDLDALLPRTIGKLADYTRGSTAAGHAVRSFGQGANSSLDLVDTATTEVGQALGRLPKAVVTKFATNGYDLSKSQALQLARQYNLTPRQITSEFRVLGIDAARSQINGILGLYHGGIAHTGGHDVPDPGSSLHPGTPGGPGTQTGPTKRKGSGGSSGASTNVHLHVDRVKVDADGYLSVLARAEVDEDGRYHTQRLEAGTGRHG